MTTTATVLKAEIKSVLETITDIAQVENYPAQDFNSFPAVEISYDGNVSEYETNHENDMLYTYNLYVFQNLDGVFDKQKSRIILEELSDVICDEFDSNEFLTGVSLPVNKTMLGIRPTTSPIGESDDGKYVMAQIELAIRVSKLI